MDRQQPPPCETLRVYAHDLDLHAVVSPTNLYVVGRNKIPYPYLQLVAFSIGSAMKMIVTLEWFLIPYILESCLSTVNDNHHESVDFVKQQVEAWTQTHPKQHIKTNGVLYYLLRSKDRSKLIRKLTSYVDAGCTASLNSAAVGIAIEDIVHSPNIPIKQLLACLSFVAGAMFGTQAWHLLIDTYRIEDTFTTTTIAMIASFLFACWTTCKHKSGCYNLFLEAVPGLFPDGVPPLACQLYRLPPYRQEPDDPTKEHEDNQKAGLGYIKSTIEYMEIALLNLFQIAATHHTGCASCVSDMLNHLMVRICPEALEVEDAGQSPLEKMCKHIQDSMAFCDTRCTKHATRAEDCCADTVESMAYLTEIYATCSNIHQIMIALRAIIDARYRQFHSQENTDLLNLLNAVSFSIKPS
jgi:hypothetical protein